MCLYIRTCSKALLDLLLLPDPGRSPSVPSQHFVYSLLCRFLPFHPLLLSTFENDFDLPALLTAFVQRRWKKDSVTHHHSTRSHTRTHAHIGSIPHCSRQSVCSWLHLQQKKTKSKKGRTRTHTHTVTRSETLVRYNCKTHIHNNKTGILMFF